MEMRDLWFETANAIDDLLVSHHGLRASLAPDHLDFSATLPDAIRRYGQGPLLQLWIECRAVERIRVFWTGKASPARADSLASLAAAGGESGTPAAEASESRAANAAEAVP
jgi:hypothetical protein